MNRLIIIGAGGHGKVIADLAAKIRNSDRIDSPMWPITQWVNGDENMSFDDAVDSELGMVRRCVETFEKGHTYYNSSDTIEKTIKMKNVSKKPANAGVFIVVKLLKNIGYFT